MKELLDVYDKNKKFLGKVIERGTKLGKGEYSLVACIVVKDEDKFIITKRDPRKSCGLMWEFTGGLVISGEKSIKGAVRELKEETGIDAKENELKYIGTKVYDKFSILVDIYMINRPINIDEIILQEGETIEAKKVSSNTIIDLHNDRLFTDFDWEIFNYILKEI